MCRVAGVSNGRLGNGCVVQRSTGGEGSSSYKTLIYPCWASKHGVY